MMLPTTRRLLLMSATTVIAITLASPALAESNDGGRKRRGPPAVAIDACTNAAAGDPCSFVGRRDQELTGTCESMRETVACVPEGRRERRERRRNGESDAE